MPLTLTDLPAEVLVKLPSGQSFLLHQARLHDPQWETDRRTIAALARTCRKLHDVFNSALYKTLVPMSLPGSRMRQLIQTISHQPHLARLVEDVKLDVFDSQFPTPNSGSPSASKVSYGEWFDLLSTLFFSNTSNLKQLAIRCKSYDKLPCDFKELTYAQIVGHYQGSGSGFASTGVKQLLLAPKMEKLILNGPFIIDRLDTLATLDSNTSNISILVLRLAMISAHTLRSILRLPRNLSYFEFYSASMGVPVPGDISSNRHLTFEDLNSALQSQIHNLGVIAIRYPSPTAGHSSIFGGLSFERFTRLTKLSMSPEMYLGWKQCVHENPHADELFGPPAPTTFANCLPHCLEELTIYLQQYQRARNGNGYAYDVVRGILHQRTRLYRLRSIELVCCKGVIFCNQCRLTALTYLDQASTVRKDEIARIKDMCAENGVSFEWIESDWADDRTSYGISASRPVSRVANDARTVR